MARGVTYVVYVLPIVFSVIFGSIVMADILQEPDRELNFMRFGEFEATSHNDSIEIIGLKKQYSTTEPIQIQVIVDDTKFGCGDLYVTIYTASGKSAVTQSGYFEQCFDDVNRFLPINERFSEIVDTAGQYEIVAEILDQNQKNSITTSEKFTVK
ncbi:MAG: hypothetical protein ACO2YR_07220 [Nitrosopumilaceae archaeon]